MQFFPSSNRSGKKPASMCAAGRISAKSDLELELERVRREKEEAERQAERIKQSMDSIPGKIKRIEEEKRRRMRDRAVKTPTIRNLGRPSFKLNSISSGLRLTRSQRRVLRNRLLMLCAAFGLVLLIFWRVVR